MEKPDPICPTCHKPAQLAREINAAVEFWECEAHHMFLADKKPPPKVSAAAAREAEAAASEAAAASVAASVAASEADPKTVP